MSNIELLRIIAIFLIIAFHCSYKSGFEFDELTINTFTIKTFWLFGELGVNLFMMITGYFLITAMFKMKRLIQLIFEILFYYLLTYLLAYSLGIYPLPQSLGDVVAISFPTIMNQYWFATAYVLIYCLSPWINRMIFSCTKKQIFLLILTMVILWSAIPTIFGIFFDSTELLLYYNRFIWFVVIYTIGAYIRLYPPKIIRSKKSCILLSITSFIIMCFFIIVISLNHVLLKKIGLTEWAYFWTPNSILMFLCSLGVFGVFLHIQMKPNKVINVIASTTLGIYLFHDGPLQHYLWPVLFNLAVIQNYTWLPFLMLASASAVFVAGILIDLARQFLERITIMKLLNSSTVDRLCRKLRIRISDGIDKFIE